MDISKRQASIKPSSLLRLNFHAKMAPGSGFETWGYSRRWEARGWLERALCHRQNHCLNEARLLTSLRGDVLMSRRKTATLAIASLFVYATFASTMAAAEADFRIKKIVREIYCQGQRVRCLKHCVKYDSTSICIGYCNTKYNSCVR